MIFLAGIHGVGKSTLMNKIKEVNNIAIYSASELISTIKTSDYIKNKNRKNIGSDQNILLKAIELFVKEKKYILDGHFCLLNNNDQITRIPSTIFEELKIEIIFILTAEINTIIHRLKKRDGINYNYDMISQFQNEEIKYGKEIADKLKKNLEVLTNEEKLLKYLEDYK